MIVPRDIPVADLSGRLIKSTGDGLNSSGSAEKSGWFASLLKSASGEGSADGNGAAAADASSDSGTATSDSSGEAGASAADVSADSNTESQTPLTSDAETQNSMASESDAAGKTEGARAAEGESGTPADEIVLQNEIRSTGTAARGDAAGQTPDGAVDGTALAGDSNATLSDAAAASENVTNPNGTSTLTDGMHATNSAVDAASSAHVDAATGIISDAEGQREGAVSANGASQSPAGETPVSDGLSPDKGTAGETPTISGDASAGAGSAAGVPAGQAGSDTTSSLNGDNRTDVNIATASQAAVDATAGASSPEGATPGASQTSTAVPVDANGQNASDIAQSGMNSQGAVSTEGQSTSTSPIAPTVNGQSADAAATPAGGNTQVTGDPSAGTERIVTGDIRSDAPAPAPEAPPAAPSPTVQSTGAQLLRELQQQAQMNGAQNRHDMVSMQQQAAELPEEELRALLKDSPVPGFQKPERHAQPGSERAPVETARAENAATAVTGAASSGGSNDASLGSAPSPIQIANSVMMNVQGAPIDAKAWKEAFASAGMEILRSTESSADAMTRLGQMEVPHMALRRELLPALESVAKQVSNAAKAAPETWQKHNFTMDDGQRVDVMIRQVEGVMHLKLSASSPDLSRLLEEYAHEIEEHLKEALAIDINLQFGQGAFDSQSMARGYGDQRGKAPYATGLADLRRQAVVPQNIQNASSVRYFGYNRMEWTA